MDLIETRYRHPSIPDCPRGVQYVVEDYINRAGEDTIAEFVGRLTALLHERKAITTDELVEMLDHRYEEHRPQPPKESA